MLSFLFVGLLISGPCLGQDNPQSGADSETAKNHIAIDEFPADGVINYIDGWGDMAVAVNEMPAGSDLGPLLEGLKNNSCQVPHWGYIMKGKLKLTYDDGHEQVLQAGELFYMPPGHVGVVEEDLKIMDFSPEKGFRKVAAHIEKKLTEAEASSNN